MPKTPGAKLFYKIGEVSRLSGVEPYILRYWEAEFPMLSPKKNKGGQRVYLQKDLDLVLRIKRMLHQEGYTIAGARKRLEELRAEARGVGVKTEAPPVSEKKSDKKLSDALGKFKKDIKDILKIIK